MSCLSDHSTYELLDTFSNSFGIRFEASLNLFLRRMHNDHSSFRSDKGQRRMSVATQFELMNFILQNSQFNPGKSSLKTKKIKKVTNEATLLFLKNCCTTDSFNGDQVFSHPAMILKSRDLKDLWKMALSYSAFSKISYRSFKNLFDEMFFMSEEAPKWSSQCFW